MPNIELVNLSCGGCFASVEETNHGGALDSFTLNYNGNVSAPITNGTNYTRRRDPGRAHADPARRRDGDGRGLRRRHVQQHGLPGDVHRRRSRRRTCRCTLALQDFTAGASGFVGETDKGGAVDNKGGRSITPTGRRDPGRDGAGVVHDPAADAVRPHGQRDRRGRRPAALLWEQNDRGGAAGTSLLNNTKTNGPLFAMFPMSGQISLSDSLQYDSPGENHLTTDPTRVFPDLQQILDNNTNADTGACPPAPIAPPVPQT